MIKEITSKFNARILVVDDYLINQEFAKQILEKMDCEVDLAEDGKEALELILEYRYDLILMDIHMPEINGFDTTQKIRALEEEKKDIPIIAVTTSALEGDVEKCIQSGMNDFVSKPYKGTDLESMLNTYIPDCKKE